MQYENEVVSENVIVKEGSITDSNLGLGVILLVSGFIGIWGVIALISAVFNFGIVGVAQAFLVSIGL